MAALVAPKVLLPAWEAEIVQDIVAELDRARGMYPPMPTAQHGYGVLLEEVEELRELVRVKDHLRDVAAMRRECEQIAAMAIRFIADLCAPAKPKAYVRAEGGSHISSRCVPPSDELGTTEWICPPDCPVEARGGNG